jgi:hypothetical protein
LSHAGLTHQQGNSVWMTLAMRSQSAGMSATRTGTGNLKLLPDCEINTGGLLGLSAASA